MVNGSIQPESLSMGSHPPDVDPFTFFFASPLAGRQAALRSDGAVPAITSPRGTIYVPA